jgi:hypothetical protein
MRILSLIVLLFAASFSPQPASAGTADADLPPLSPLTPPPEPTIAVPTASNYAPTLLIYLARGPADACGAGCDRWIAIEGNIDRAAAVRVSAFLRETKDTRLPIYFQSPGGEVEPSLEIGRLLRNRKAIGRVGKTVAALCSGGTQIDEACLRIKAGSNAIDAKLVTENAMCSSACVYMLLGATAREVAPDAGLGVHDSKMFLRSKQQLTKQERDQALERMMVRGRRELASFTSAMGIDAGLLELIRSVPFEKAHLLTRSELYRFGIDRRSFVQTPWNVVMLPKAHLRKKAVIRNADGTFVPLEWQLHCTTQVRGNLMFAREIGAGSARATQMTLQAEADQPKAFSAFLPILGKVEAWHVSFSEADVTRWAAAPVLKTAANTTKDGNVAQWGVDIDTLGLDEGWKLLTAVCPRERVVPPPPKPVTAPATGFNLPSNRPKTIDWPDPQKYISR